MRIHLLPVFILAAILTSCQSQSGRLSNAQASKRLEEIWNAHEGILPLGELAAIRPVPGVSQNRTKGQISLSELKDLRHWQETGVIQISNVRDLSQAFTGWSNWFALTQEGIQFQLTATAGPKAPSAPCAGDYRKTWGTRSLLCVPWGQTVVESVVQNEAQSIGTDRYQIVLGTSRRTPSELYAEFYKRSGSPPDQRQKFKVALRFDPFANEWTVAAADVSAINADFETDFVNRLLGSK